MMRYWNILIILAIVLLAQSMGSTGCIGKPAPDKQAGKTTTHKKETGEAPVPAIDVKPIEPVLRWEVLLGRKLPERMLREFPGDEVLVADSIGNILALSVEDGSQRIVIHTTGPIMGWDRVMTLLIASSSIDKQVRLNDIRTGEEIWSFGCETTPSEPAYTVAGIAVAEGLGPYRVRHLAIEDGHQLWSAEFDAKPGGYAAVVGVNLLYMAFEDRYVRALNLKDGRMSWEFRVGEPLEIKPDGRWKGRYDFLGTEGDAVARSKPFQIGGIGMMLITRWGLVVPSEDGYIRCLDPSDGALKWERKFDDRVWHAWFEIDPLNPKLYCDTIEGRLASLDPKTGDIRNSVDLIEPTYALIYIGSLIIADTTGQDGEIIIRRSDDFTEVKRLNIGVNPTNGFMTMGRLITRTEDGRIACIEMPEF